MKRGCADVILMKEGRNAVIEMRKDWDEKSDAKGRR